MPKKTTGLLSFIALILVLLVSSCNPPPSPPILELSETELSFDIDEQIKTVDIQNLGGGDLDWSATSNVSWITVSPTSGSGDGEITISVNRDGLNEFSENTGLVTVTDGEAGKSIRVATVSAYTPVDTSYFPLAPGNSWSFALPDIGATRQYLGDVVTLSAVAPFTVQGRPAWEMELTLPGLQRETILAPWNLPFPEDILPRSKRFYLVSESNAWFVAIDRAALDSLPSTGRLLPLSVIVRYPGLVAYILATDAIEDYTARFVLPVARASEGINDLAGQLNTYAQRLEPTAYRPLFRLTNDFGNQFSTYTGENLVASNFINLLATIMKAIEPTYDAYLELVVVAYLHLDALGSLPPAGADFLEDLEVYLAEFSAYFQDYESTSPLLKAALDVISTAAQEGSIYIANQRSYTQTDVSEVNSLLNSLVVFLSSNMGRFILQPSDFPDRLRDYLLAYETAHAPTLEVITSILAVVEPLESLIDTLADTDSIRFDFLSLDSFLQEWTVLNDAILNNSDNYLALGVAVYLNTATSLLGELLLLEPNLNEMLANLETLYQNLREQGFDSLEISGAIAVFSDVTTYFNGYAENQADPLAQAASVGTFFIEEMLATLRTVLTELQEVPFATARGSLSELTPSTTMGITMNQYGVTDQLDCIAAQILIEDGRFLTTEGPYDAAVSTVIFSKDIGPVMLGFLPLRSAVINGRVIGRPAV